MSEVRALAGLTGLLAFAGAGCLWAEKVAVDLFGPPDVSPKEVYDAHGGSFDPHPLNPLFARIVDSEGRVDYLAILEDPSTLDSALERLAAVDLAGLARDHRLAVLINAYNIFTLALIRDHYPVDSIRDIPSNERWKAVRWNLGGSEVSLHQIEHDMLRRNFVEPRIHFAINCASESCPPLLPEAYDGARIEEQLDQVTRWVHTPGSRWLDLTTEGAETRIELTRIYLWYEPDFLRVADSVAQFAQRWLQLDAPPTDVGYLAYDWSLNQSRSSTVSEDVSPG